MPIDLTSIPAASSGGDGLLFGMSLAGLLLAAFFSLLGMAYLVYAKKQSRLIIGLAGIALLVLLGAKTPVGQFLKEHGGIEVSGSLVGIVACQVFVSSPFLVRSAINAFHDMGPAVENVSRTLGASPASTFLRVSLPLAAGAIFNGAILTWARAISEAGSLMVLAYHPFTVSVYTYDVFVQYGISEARPAAVLLVIVCLWGFLVLRWLRGTRLGPVLAMLRR